MMEVIKGIKMFLLVALFSAIVGFFVGCCRYLGTGLAHSVVVILGAFLFYLSHRRMIVFFRFEFKIDDKKILVMSLVMSLFYSICVWAFHSLTLAALFYFEGGFVGDAILFSPYVLVGIIFMSSVMALLAILTEREKSRI